VFRAESGRWYFARAVKRLIPDGEMAIDVRRSLPDSG